MSYPNRPPPGGPSYYRQAGYEANSSAFNSTSYPSTTSFDPSAAYGQPQNQQGGVGRRQTVRGAQRGTIRDAQANPHQSTSGGGGGGGAVQRGLTRGKTLTRPDRFVAPAPLITPAGLGKGGKQGGNVQTKLVGGVPTLVTQEPWYDPWSLFVEVSTFWAPRALLRGMGMTDPTKQRAWKEKCALCEVAMFLMGVVGFITIGLNRVLCPTSGPRSADAFITVGKTAGYVGVEGWSMQVNSITPTSLSTPAASYGGTDETGLFDRSTYTFSGCDGFSNAWATANLCNTATSTGNSTTCTLKAPTATYLASLGLTNSTKQVGYDWDQLSNFTNFIVIDGNVLNLTPYLKAYPTALKNDTVDAAIRFMLDDTASGSTKDATRIFYNTDDLKTAASCLTQRYYAGHIDKVTPGCFAANLFLYVSLILIMGIVLARFAMACVFSWYLAARMVRKPSNLKRNVVSPAVLPEGANIDVNNTTGAAPWTESHIKRQQTMRLQKKGGAAGGRKGRGGGGDLEKPLPSAAMGKDEEPLPVSTDGMISAASIGAELFTVCLVTCYSEGHDGIKTTLDSIAATSYSDARKLIFVVCDGMITGSGEKLSTPDIVVGMIEREARFGDPQPMSYVAVADGPKAHNQALVYAGHYTSVPGHRTPIVVVVKCGPPSEASENKPGNRGKRDSQMILMNFFSRVTYNDRMCPLDYDLFRKTQSLMGVTADFFELCLMVDADTMCYPEALGYLVRSMQNDNMIMGICGETRIANKRQSWVTMIQVFEYFISHHLAKSFESVFGGVTCLPGCFSMYRIKARKQDDGDWFPVLVQPTIVSEYSQSVVTTLHQKNLLLLGEDRFLTTLLLRNFPNRKMMFCPYARCRTVVPDTFSILLSQRRRWINSTIHNLMELILVRNLCGTFCFSMQFITFIDLVGTVVLPIAICLTYSLIINYIFTPPTGFSDAIPLVLLAGVLGLPAILIVLTTFKIVYVGWMLIYLIALPIWNFVLPIYAFSKFDDFSWGETRKVAGETKGADDHGGAGGVSGASAVPLRRWEDWERSRLRKLKREEKRKREFERQFGSRAVHGTTSNGGSTYGGDSETASSYGGGDEDRWGLQIGAYNEDASTVANAPPPVGLYSVDEWEEEDDSETINQHDLVNVLDQGWDDNSPIPSPSPSYSRQMPGPPLGVGGVGGGSGYSTPTEQQQYYGRDGGLGAQPYPHSQYPQQQQQQPPPRLYSLSDAPAMNRSASSQSASQRVPLTASSASLASSGEAVTSSGSGEGNPFSDPLAASASSSGIDHNNGWRTGGGHARQRSLTSSPEVVNRTGGGGTGSYGPLGGSNTPSPTRERGGYDFGDAGGRRLL